MLWERYISADIDVFVDTHLYFSGGVNGLVKLALATSIRFVFINCIIIFTSQLFFMIKIIHTADNHLGMKFNGRSYSEAVRQYLVDNRFDALAKLVEIANSKRADLFVIAGDLFDTVNMQVNQIKKTAEILNRFSGTVLVLPGNHDYFEESTNGLWQKLNNYLKQEQVVILSKSQPYNCTIGEHEIIVFPGPCSSKHSYTNAIDWIEATGTENAITIGLAHGHVPGYGPGSDCYFNMEEAELASKHLDLWLLGHIHVPFPKNYATNKPNFLYSGTHAADGFDCSHNGNAWYMEMDQNDFRLEPIVCNDVSFKEMKTGLTTEADLQGLDQELSKFADKKTLLKLSISGRLNEGLLQLLQQRIDAYRELFLYLEVDNKVKMDLDPEYIDRQFKEDSLPHQLLTQLSTNPDDYLALQVAFELINESKQ
jgi:DNA repair protein SbcD/Mre11